jgi:hypothetical protein
MSRQRDTSWLAAGKARLERRTRSFLEILFDARVIEYTLKLAGITRLGSVGLYGYFVWVDPGEKCVPLVYWFEEFAGRASAMGNRWIAYMLASLHFVDIE